MCIVLKSIKYEELLLFVAMPTVICKYLFISNTTRFGVDMPHIEMLHMMFISVGIVLTGYSATNDQPSFYLNQLTLY